MSVSALVIEPAVIERRDGQPFNTEFQDIYHASDGPDEVARVFLGPSGFLEKSAVQPRITVGELGLGTGLNFVMAAERCLETGCALHFVSFEAAPIAPDTFSQLASERARRQPFYQLLADAYPPLIRGWHRRHFADGQITLSVYFGSAQAGLEDLQGRQKRSFDIWFLDGFDPRRNPELWAEPLFAELAALSGTGTGVATFSAAGRVRRGLQAAGFEMRRVDQRPHKRESLAGVMTSPRTQTSEHPQSAAASGAITIHGGGLAGAQVARHLADLGIACTVLDNGQTDAASNIPAMTLHGRLLSDESPAAALRCHAYLYSAAFCRDRPGVNRTGALQGPGANLKPDKLAAISERYAASGDWIRKVNSKEAADIAGCSVAGEMLHFPESAVVNARELIAALLDHEYIDVRAATNPLTSLGLNPQDTNVLACGAYVHGHPAARYLEIAAVGGQVDLVTMTEPPRVPIQGNGYLAPLNDCVAVGATYEYQPWTAERATATNLERLGRRAYTWLGRMRGVRCVASDRTPIAGALHTLDGDPLANLLVSTGHGSTGCVSTAFAAALLASRINGDFAPVTRDLEALMSPARFRERQARRGYRHGGSQ